MTSLSVTCSRRTRPHNFHDQSPRVAYRPHAYIVFCTFLTTTLSLRVGRDQPTQWENCPLQIPMGVLWHYPGEGPLSRPFTNYTHNTSYARGGPSSYFSQSPELCVATSKYL